METGYCTEATTATLKSGLALTIRSLRPDDRERMAQAVHGLDQQSIYTRLFSHRRELTESGLERIMRNDQQHELVIVATIGTGESESIIGSGRYVITAEAPLRRAEIAFVVEEDYQGQGVAGGLLRALAAAARAHNVAVFEAEVLAENPSMLRVFQRSGLPMQRRTDGGVVHLELALA